MASKKLSLLIAEDHNLVRNGIISILKNNKKHLFDIHEAKDGTEATSMAKKNNYDIILMDITMPKMDGITATKEILKRNKTQKVLTLTMHDEITYVQDAMKSGSQGYVLKDSQPDELINAISIVLNGKKYLSSDMAIRLFEAKTAKTEKASVLFSERELQVIKLLIQAKTSAEIAKDLNLGKRTVDTHRSNIMAKCNVKNTAGIIKYVYDNKILPIKN